MENSTEKLNPGNAFLKSVAIALPKAFVSKYTENVTLTIKIEWIDALAFKNLVSIAKVYHQDITIHPAGPKMAIMFSQKEVAR